MTSAIINVMEQRWELIKQCVIMIFMIDRADDPWWWGCHLYLLIDFTFPWQLYFPFTFKVTHLISLFCSQLLHDLLCTVAYRTTAKRYVHLCLLPEPMLHPHWHTGSFLGSGAPVHSRVLLSQGRDNDRKRIAKSIAGPLVTQTCVLVVMMKSVKMKSIWIQKFIKRKES